ncbi:DUF2617 family protein [Kocuria varians]|uniref:DUF2617 family protein n=1 Tax=Kocuria varians TaxID=1272 RepID=UPI001F235B42|nr:DUF2617 family protein [Kocuria varians]
MREVPAVGCRDANRKTDTMEHLWLTPVPGHAAHHPEDFGFRTDLGVLDAPASRTLRIDDATDVELRVAPGRHQCVISHDGEQWIETVGVFDEGASALPVLRSLAHPTPFASHVETGCTVTEHSPRGLRKELRRLWETLENTPLALAVQDPDEPAAVTAAACHVDTDSGVLMWRTWRVLPETGFVVRTRAELRLAATARAAA